MPDMLVRLYRLPELAPALSRLGDSGIEVRPALVLEKRPVLAWVGEHFASWATEAEAAFGRMPVSCHLALRGESILGFACHDALCRNFFGPMGVLERERGGGVGKALLLSALHVLKAQGYAYAVIGGVGPQSFYEQTVGATLIADSHPGIYRGILRRADP
jgi:GNAT superfamily N-acetyltransferase